MEVTRFNGVKARLEAGEVLTAPRLEMLAYLVDQPIRLARTASGSTLVIDSQSRFFEVTVRYGILIAKQRTVTVTAFQRVWNAAWRMKAGDQRTTLIDRLAKTDAAANALTVLALVGKAVRS